MEDKKVLSATSDYLFKLMFFDEVDKDEILKMLLVDCIGFDDKQVSEITLLDTTDDREHRDDKLIILDIKAKLSDGTFVNVEVQKLEEKNYIKRCAYYTCRVFGKQAVKGLDYIELKQTVSLNIADFELYKDDKDFYRSFYLVDTVHDIKLDNIVRMDIMELAKVNKDNLDKSDKRALWAMFFNAKTEGDLDMIKDIDNSFEIPVRKLKRLSSDPRVLTVYEEEQKALADQRSRENSIKREALAEGKTEEKIEIAIKLLKSGANIDFVAEITGLTYEEVKRLKL